MKNSKQWYVTMVTWCILATGIMLTLSCSNDDHAVPETPVRFTTVSGNEINMNGTWTSDCVLANNNMILKETFTFNDDRFEIDIKGYDDMQCSGDASFSELVKVVFTYAGTTTVDFNGSPTTVNRIDGTASYTDGRSEVIKQMFLIDDTSGTTFLHHALFADDGGQTDAQGYPIEIIPIPIFKD